MDVLDMRELNDPVAVASRLVALLCLSGDRLSVEDLRVLAFVENMSVQNRLFPKHRDTVDCTEIRSLAREELIRRGKWRVVDWLGTSLPLNLKKAVAPVVKR